jgi:hypothetical protein
VAIDTFEVPLTTLKSCLSIKKILAVSAFIKTLNLDLGTFRGYNENLDLAKSIIQKKINGIDTLKLYSFRESVADILNINPNCFQSLHTLRVDHQGISQNDVKELAGLPNLRVLEAKINDRNDSLTQLHTLKIMPQSQGFLTRKI